VPTDLHMNLHTNRMRRALVAVATSILTGATAGAALARRPLVVTVDRPRQPFRTHG
jgi:hypothetical protein